MKSFIVFAALFVFALAVPVEHHDEHHHQILKLDSESDPKGFKYSYETSNGIHQEEEGQLKDVGHGHHDGHGHGHDGHTDDHEAVVVHGSFAWIDEKTGAKFNIQYKADENGYHPAPIKLPHH